MAKPWLGSRRLAVIPAVTNGGGSAPSNFVDRIRERLFFDPDPATTVDRSLRRYIHTVSYGRASLDIEVLDPVNVNWAIHGSPAVPDPGTTMDAAIAGAGPRVQTFPHVMVVFPPIPGIRSWAFFGSGGQAHAYVFLSDAIGAWAMELLHMVTEFRDLYGSPANRAPSPGGFDEMDTADATHPSAFTKLKMGWLDVTSMASASPGSTHRLHPIGRLQPPPPGRTAALKIALDRVDHFLLVESRERVDEYESATPGLTGGIPSEGVVVFDVDESVWPPLWLRTVPALTAGQTFVDAISATRMEVVSRLPGGGHEVRLPVPEPARCRAIRSEIERDLGERATLQRELQHAAPGDKPAITGQIKGLNRRIARLRVEAEALNCLKIPPL